MKKVLIEIPESEYLMISKSDDTAFATMTDKEAMMYAIKSGKVISEMTNGEVIKALFPEYEFEKNKLHDERLTSSLGLDIMECLTEDIYVSKCWWNAPYEEEVEE